MSRQMEQLERHIGRGNGVKSHRCRRFAALIGLLFLLDPLQPAYACSMVPASVVFTGVARHRTLHTVTYDVVNIEMEPRRPSSRPTLSTVPEQVSVDVGTPIVIRYDDRGSKFVDLGKSYTVAAWFSRGVFHSGVATAEDVCGGGGTSHADRSRIDTARTVLRIRVWPYWATLGASALLFLIVRYRLIWFHREDG